jgi:hypothetical protein
MDAGCYCAHSLRFFPGCSRPQVGPQGNSAVSTGSEQPTASQVLHNGHTHGRTTATHALASGCSSCPALTLQVSSLSQPCYVATCRMCVLHRTSSKDRHQSCRTTACQTAA